MNIRGIVGVALLAAHVIAGFKAGILSSTSPFIEMHGEPPAWFGCYLLISFVSLAVVIYWPKFEVEEGA